MPTPAELKAATEKARIAKAEYYAEQARKEAEKREAHRQSVAAEAEVYINTLDRQLEYATVHGKTDAKVSTAIGGSFSWAGPHIELYRELVKPRLEQYYADQGLTGRWIEDHTTEYGSDGAGPGPTYISFEVSWDD